MLLTIFSWMSLLATLSILAILSYIDIKERRIPNETVLGLFTFGAIFHFTTMFRFVDLNHIIAGILVSFCCMFMLRTIANHIYKQDALGLGDVKLITAGGLWLGIEGIFIAIIIGATAGVIQGLAIIIKSQIKYKRKLHLKDLQIPAGPAFSFGMVCVGIWLFRDIIYPSHAFYSDL